MNGPFGNGYPYVNFHEMNMDWVIRIAKDFLDEYTNIQQTIDHGLEDLDTKATELQALLDAWYEEHSQDIADQLAQALEDLNTWYTQHEGYLDQYVTDSIAAFGTAADTKAAQTIATIPDDYTSLSNEVTNLTLSTNQDNYNLDGGTDYNMFNIVSALKGKDISDADDGLIVDNASYMVSHKIVFDFSKLVKIQNITATPNLYCYDRDDTYLGRFNCNTTSSATSTVYPTTAYVRIVPAITDVNVKLVYAMGRYFAEYNPIAGWLDKTKRIALLNASALNESEYGNFYNPDDAAHGFDIDSNTGRLMSSAEYLVSGKIVTDFTRRTTIANCSYRRFYCYDVNDTYLGRYDPGSSSTATPANQFPGTAYYRFVAKETDTNIMVFYANHVLRDAFTPYSGIRKAFEKAIINDPVNIRVSSYNMGDFTGIDLVPGAEETAIAYRKTIGDLESEFCCMQFDVRTFGTHGDAIDYIVTNKRYVMWHGNNNRNYDYFGVVADFLTANEEKILYQNAGEYNLTHTWFEVFDMIYHGKMVHFINVHFEWYDNDMRAQQITEVLDNASDYENCIIAGDFNPEDRTNGEWNGTPGTLTYEADLARFTAAGFTAGNAGQFGVINTLAHDSLGLEGPWDNILVKGNIKIRNFNKLERDYMNDHYPVYADITIW